MLTITTYKLLYSTKLAYSLSLDGGFASKVPFASKVDKLPQKSNKPPKKPERWRKISFLALGIPLFSIGLLCFASLYPHIAAPIYTVAGLTCIGISVHLFRKEKRERNMLSTRHPDKNAPYNGRPDSHISKTSPRTVNPTKKCEHRVNKSKNRISKIRPNNSDPTECSKQENNTTNDKKKPFHNTPPRNKS